MPRRHTTVLLLTCAAAASAQLPADPVKAESAFGNRDVTELDCEISTEKPTVDYRFVSVARGKARIPATTFEGARHYVDLLLRIHGPAAKQPVYLAEHQNLPRVPKETKGSIEVEFGFAAGEGRYSVDLMIIDDARRVCRREFNVQAGRVSFPGGVQSPVAPGVASRADRPDFTAPPKGWMPGGRLTILVNAAALRTRDTASIPDEDVLALSDAAFSVLREANPERARIVVFSLTERRELLRTDSAGLADMAADIANVTRAIGSAPSGKIDYAELKQTAPEFLERLIAAEMTAEAAPDTVILISPPVRSFEPVPKFPMPERGRMRSLWLLELLPIAPALRGPTGVRPPLPFSLGGQQAPDYISPHEADIVSQVIDKAHGHASLIAAPLDLAAAIARIRKAAN